MRREFVKVIIELIRKDKRLHLINLDVGQGMFDELIKEAPNNYWNFGVMEQAAIGIAAGMALEGLKPYVYSITPFVLERPFEQIKLDIVDQNADVKLVGFWNYPSAGITHLTKDVAGLCKILEIPLYEPKSSEETRKLLLETYLDTKPAFFNLTKDPTK